MAEQDYEIIYKPRKINENADALSRNPTTKIYPINPFYDLIEECPEDDEARQRNANPKPLPASPRRGIMVEEPEPIVSRMQTRKFEKSQGESVPFTRRELEEPSSIEHTIQAQIHNYPTNQTNNTLSIIETNNTHSETNNIENDMRKTLETETIPLRNCSNNNFNTSQIIIPPNLLQIINNLTGDEDEKIESGEINEREEERIEEDNNDEVSDRDEDSDDDLSDKDIDETYNEINLDEGTDNIERQIITRGQRHSIINSRDQIYMRKENYLYFLTADGKPCDEGSKQLQKQNLIPKIKEKKVGDFEIFKKGNENDEKADLK